LQLSRKGRKKSKLFDKHPENLLNLVIALVMSKKQFFFITFPLDQLLQPMKFVVGMENVDEMTITN